MADVENNGCSSKRVRRRYARLALFKRFTVEELERRYQEYGSILRPEEDQTVRQTIEQFKKGWYTVIGALEWIGTFYSPVSPLFTLLFLHLRLVLGALMPFTYIFCKKLCRKGTPSIGTICLLPIFPIFFVRELLRLVIYVFTVPVFLLLATPLELIVFLGGMCYYRFGRLRKCGVFVYDCKLRLAIVRKNRTLLVTSVTKLALHHASFCRSTFCNPITAILGYIRWDEYSYGDIQGVYLSAREVEMYRLYQQGTVALRLQEEGLA